VNGNTLSGLGGAARGGGGGGGGGGNSMGSSSFFDSPAGYGQRMSMDAVNAMSGANTWGGYVPGANERPPGDVGFSGASGGYMDIAGSAAGQAISQAIGAAQNQMGQMEAAQAAQEAAIRAANGGDPTSEDYGLNDGDWMWDATGMYNGFTGM